MKRLYFVATFLVDVIQATWRSEQKTWSKYINTNRKIDILLQLCVTGVSSLFQFYVKEEQFDLTSLQNDNADVYSWATP